MEGYAITRLERSQGAPVSINQSAMAAHFARSTSGPRGPALRTISRHWDRFTSRMQERGFVFVRGHSDGVDLRGRRVTDMGARGKLGWIVYSAGWERRGGQMLNFTPRKGRRSKQPGQRTRSRWLRDRERRLIPPPLPRSRQHYANSAPTPYSLPNREQRMTNKQSAAGATGLHKCAGKERHSQATANSKSWRIPEPVLRAIWGLSRRHLAGEATPLAKRALWLWCQGFPGSRLLREVRRAASWAMEASHGHRGRIAAAVLAQGLMNPHGVPHRPPCSAEFRSWAEGNSAKWKAAAVLRARQHRDAVAEEFARSLGITVAELRRRMDQSIQNASTKD